MSSEWVGRSADVGVRTREAVQEPKKPRKDPVLQAAAVIGALFFVFCLIQLNFNYSLLFQGTWKFVQSLALMFPPNAAEWNHVLAAALETLQIAFVGTVLAVCLAFVLSFLAAENLSPRTAPVIKGFASFLRAIPTLVWALIFIVAVGMGPFPGILAICTHATGMLIKVFSQSIEEVDEGVIEAMRATGASWLQIVCQGILPCVSTSFLAWSVFRLEADIGESSILGVVGAGGIGFEIANAMRAYEFDSACFVALVIFAMVFTVELCSNRFEIQYPKEAIALLKRSQVTRILIEGDRELLRSLCAQVEQTGEVEIVKAPEKSLVMSKARDSVSGLPFYVGEILVTECTVALGVVHGFGMLIGEDAEKAYELAVVDAALNAKLPLTSDWFTMLELESGRIAERHAREEELVMKTRVHFDTMEESYGKR